MEKFNTDGIVIKMNVTGEADLILCVLTRSKGIIRAFAKGARSTKSKLHAASSLFAYCDFSFYEKNGVYHVTEAQVKELFFTLRADVVKMSLAQYFCEFLLKTLPEGDTEDAYLQLMLRALFCLCKDKQEPLLVKSVFELRCVTVSGYAPALHACAACGAFQTERMYFNCLTGELFCDKCGDRDEVPQIPFPVVAAMRHIIFSPFEKAFSFRLNNELHLPLTRLTEKYAQNCFQQKFKTLDFFWTVYQ